MIILYTIIFVLVQLLLLPVYNLIYKRLFSKFDFKLTKTIRIIATIVSPVIFTVLLYFPIYRLIESSIRSKEFNTELWKNGKTERYKMVNDLRKNILIGKEKENVLKMLGKNDGNCGHLGTENTLCYLTYDPENAFGIDHYELIIWFDNFNKVKRVAYEML